MNKLNKLRQVKDVVYKPKQSKRTLTITELIEKYPNDADLGREVRKLKNK